jgi:HAD superfamily hydrolase (TIGR01509 family)
MSFRAALFDIDGTLVDSNYLHIEAWAHAFAQLGLAVDGWRIHRGMGMDSSKLLEELLGDDSDEFADRAKDLHTKYYEELAPRLRAFDGVRELLATLDARGVIVVLATSAPEAELEKLRAVLRVEDSIAIVTGGDDVETAKPAPDIVQVALDRAGVAPGEAIMIGDTIWDVTAAASAGVACIGVQAGGVSAGELLDAGATRVYADIADLYANLETGPFA